MAGCRRDYPNVGYSPVYTALHWCQDVLYSAFTACTLKRVRNYIGPISIEIGGIHAWMQVCQVSGHPNPGELHIFGARLGRGVDCSFHRSCPGHGPCYHGEAQAAIALTKGVVASGYFTADVHVRVYCVGERSAEESSVRFAGTYETACFSWYRYSTNSCIILPVCMCALCDCTAQNLL